MCRFFFITLHKVASYPVDYNLITKIIKTCSPVIGHLFDTIVFGSPEKDL